MGGDIGVDLVLKPVGEAMAAQIRLQPRMGARMAGDLVPVGLQRAQLFDLARAGLVQLADAKR
ncbi:MAG: hypothetical protein M5U35_13210 [Roseovarius sp.]|nr:hypothetical protein [Roseovarius sp.]